MKVKRINKIENMLYFLENKKEELKQIKEENEDFEKIFKKEVDKLKNRCYN